MIWETGKTCSAAMTGIRWDGPQLGRRDSVEWSVRLWDEHDQEGPWQTTRFELGLLEPSDWRATWITSGYRPRRRRRHPVDHFRTTFTVPGELTTARLYITACGLYRATINGHRVGAFVMAPGFTSYQKRLHYQTYDVGALLTTGVNIVQVELADGWFRGAVGAMGVRNVYGAQTKLLAQLKLVDAAALLISLGLPIGVPVVALVLAGLLHVRGLAGRLAAAFRIDPAAERHPLPAATTAPTA